MMPCGAKLGWMDGWRHIMCDGYVRVSNLAEDNEFGVVSSSA